VDTSVLIDYFSGVPSAAADALDDVLARGPVPSTAPVIVQEFLQGFSTARDLREGRRILRAFHRLVPPDYDLHERAARWHVRMRARGETMSSVDVLVVTIAARWRCGLLTGDRQQRLAAATMGVRLI
jgi:predicted nucleic acid-binding protein